MVKNGLLTLGALLVGLLALEGLTRLAIPQPTPGLPEGMVRIIDSSWRLTPGFVGVMDNTVDFVGKRFVTDADGYRAVPSAAAVPPGAPRLFLLGDSQTFGHGLDDGETWAEALQQRLAASGRAVKVANLAIPGINVDQYLVKMRTMVLPVARRGDAVLIGLSWNDLTTPQTASFVQAVLGGEEITPPPASATPTTTAPAAEGDHAPLRERLKTYDDAPLWATPFDGLKRVAATLRDHSALGALAYRAAQGFYFGFRDENPIVNRLKGGVADANFALLAVMKRQAEEAGVAFSVLFLNDRLTVDDALFDSFFQAGRFFAAQDVMGSVATPLCAESGLVCLNPFEVMRRENKAAPIFFPVDGHYNERGAAVIADYLAENAGTILGE